MCGAAVTAQAVYSDQSGCVMHELSLEESSLRHKCVVQWLEHSLWTMIRGGSHTHTHTLLAEYRCCDLLSPEE